MFCFLVVTFKTQQIAPNDSNEMFIAVIKRLWGQLQWELLLVNGY